MKEEWLFPGAMVPVDMETTTALVAELKRLIDVVGGMVLAQPVQEPDELTIAYMSGLYDGKKKRPWVGLTDEKRDEILDIYLTAEGRARAIEAELKELNT